MVLLNWGFSKTIMRMIFYSRISPSQTKTREIEIYKFQCHFLQNLLRNLEFSISVYFLKRYTCRIFLFNLLN